MRLTRVRTRDFLALDRLDLQLTGGRTVITGQNNVGKSTVLAAVSLALDAVAASAGGDARRLDPAWSRAGHRGAQRFEMRLGVEFADAEERLLFDQFLLGAWVSLLYPRGRELAIAEAVSGALEEHPAEMMTAGELLVSFDSTARDRWAVAWEFGPPEARAHVRLLGPQSDYVCPGAAAHRPATTRAQGALAASTNDLLDRLQAGSVPLSLKAVLEQGSYSFEVDVAEMDQLPAEVRAVAEEVDAAGKNLGSIRLGHLLDSLLAREVVVTPNHRSAPRAEFTPAELHTASRRRDGSMLASELHRLKNGRAEERAVFARVQALFQRLTGQRVDCVVENLSPDLQDIDGPRFRVTVVLSRERLVVPGQSRSL